MCYPRHVQRAGAAEHPSQGAAPAGGEGRSAEAGGLEKGGLSEALQQAGLTRGEPVSFSDEMRLGLRGTVRRVLAPRGVRVVQKVQLVYQWSSLLLAVDPRQGHLRWEWIERMNTASVLPVLRR